MKLRAFFATTTLLGALFSVAISSRADCYSIYTNASAICSTAQANRDYTTLSNYDAAVYASITNYNATAFADYSVQTNQVQQCLDGLTTNLMNCLKDNNYNADGTHDDSSAITAYDAATNSCETNYPNDPSSYDQCVCQAGDQRDFLIYMDGVYYNECCTEVRNKEQYNCEAPAYANQAHDDNIAVAVGINASWSAYATEQKAIILSSYIAAICSDTACWQDDICGLNADCSANPANCCVDRAAINFCNAYINYDTVYYNKVGAAQADEEYKLITCDYTANHDDQVTYATDALAVALANADYNYNFYHDANVYDGELNKNAADCLLAESLCDCTNTTGLDCDTGPEAEKATKNAAALVTLKAANDGPYDTPIGSNWSDLNDTSTKANSVAQGEYDAHNATHTSCTARAQSTYQNISDAAGTQWNLAMAAASKAEQDAIKACNNIG